MTLGSGIAVASVCGLLAFLTWLFPSAMGVAGLFALMLVFLLFITLWGG